MPIYAREQQYIALLANEPHTVRELSEKLFVSEPTVRRDIAVMREKELVDCRRGTVTLKTRYPDHRIPLFVRDIEHNEEKKAIALSAVKHIRDGDVIMLDASTTVYHIVPHLAVFKNILVITSGARTAMETASMGIKTICTGGEMLTESFSYIGSDAEQILSKYNANVAFFSCRGISEDGRVTDPSIGENSIRRIMMKNAEKSVLLCDRSKLGHSFLHTLCHTSELDDVITNAK